MSASLAIADDLTAGICNRLAVGLEHSVPSTAEKEFKIFQKLILLSLQKWHCST
jgi:hypothetical protein